MDNSPIGASCKRSLLLVSSAFLALCVNSISLSAQSSSHSYTSVVQTCTSSQTLSTDQNQSTEVLFPDGTSVILSPESSVTVGCGAVGGGISVTVEQGLVRISGGSTNDTTPIAINVPDAILALSNGAAIVDVNTESTRTHLLNGGGLVITANGSQRTLYRPGFQVSVQAGSAPTTPRKMTVGAIVSDLQALSVGLQNGTRPITRSRSSTAPQGSNIVQSRQQSATTTTISTSGTSLQDDLLAGNNTVNTNTISMVPTPPTPTPGPNQPPTVSFGNNIGGINLAGKFGARAGNGVSANGQTTSTVSFARGVTEVQDHGVDTTFNDVRVLLGPNTNRVFSSGGLEQSFGGTSGASAPTRFISNNGEIIQSWVLSDSRAGGGGYNIFGYLDPGLSNREGGIDIAGLSDGSFYFDLDGIDVVDGVFKDAPSISTSTNPSDLDDGWTASSALGAPKNPTNAFSRSDTDAGVGVVATGIMVNAGKENKKSDNFLLSIMSPADAYNFIVPEFDFGFSDFDTEFVVDDRGSTYTCNPGLIDCANESEVEADINAFYLAETTRLANGRQYFFNGLNQSSASLNNGDVTGPAAIIVDPAEQRRIVFASGDLDGLASDPDGIIGSSINGFSVDTFHLTGDMNGAISNGISSGLVAGMDLSTGRAFMRRETWEDLDPNGGLSLNQLEDSGFMLANPTGAVIDPSADPDNSIGDDGVVLHADFGLEYVNGVQVSSISTTIGKVDYRAEKDNNGKVVVDGIISAKTIGTSRGVNAVSGENSASVFISSDLQSTAAGGGNTNLDPDAGRLGFFVLENYGQAFDEDASGKADKVLTGGNESALGSSNSTNYALLRVGVGTKTQRTVQDRNHWGSNMIGYAAGFVETETALNSLPVTLSTSSTPYGGGNATPPGPNLSFGAQDLATNTFSATLTFSDGTMVDFGGAGQSAYINDLKFGALSDVSNTNVSMALISGDLISGAFENKFETSDSTSSQKKYISKPVSSEHVKWGFFFGDKVATGNARQHVQLGSFASGEAITENRMNVTAVTATYSGHAIGNVYDNGNIRTVVGTYRDDFNFKNRKGKITMDFDKRKYSGKSFNKSGFNYTGGLKSGSRSGTVSGQFVSKGGRLKTRGALKAPGGLIGSFNLKGKNYRTTGSIGASWK